MGVAAFLAPAVIAAAIAWVLLTRQLPPDRSERFRARVSIGTTLLGFALLAWGQQLVWSRGLSPAVGVAVVAVEFLVIWLVGRRFANWWVEAVRRPSANAFATMLSEPHVRAAVATGSGVIAVVFTVTALLLVVAPLASGVLPVG